MKMRIEFDRNEAIAAIRAAYEAKFGPVPDDYEIHITRPHSYSDSFEIDVIPREDPVVAKEPEVMS